MPSPPCDRSSDRSTCVKMSKTCGSISAGMPTPVSRTLTDDVASSPLDLERDPAARLGVLGGIVQQVRDHLREPGRVGVDDRSVSGGS